eukprot:scaffold5608_cov386-Prasinococcus_capsulatus_cf.AAC.6
MARQRGAPRQQARHPMRVAPEWAPACLGPVWRPPAHWAAPWGRPARRGPRPGCEGHAPWGLGTGGSPSAGERISRPPRGGLAPCAGPRAGAVEARSGGARVSVRLWAERGAAAADAGAASRVLDGAAAPRRCAEGSGGGGRAGRSRTRCRTRMPRHATPRHATPRHARRPLARSHALGRRRSGRVQATSGSGPRFPFSPCAPRVSSRGRVQRRTHPSPDGPPASLYVGRAARHPGLGTRESHLHRLVAINDPLA